MIKSSVIQYDWDNFTYPIIFGEKREKMNWYPTIYPGWFVRSDYQVLRNGDKYVYADYCKWIDCYVATLPLEKPTFLHVDERILSKN